MRFLRRLELSSEWLMNLIKNMCISDAQLEMMRL